MKGLNLDRVKAFSDGVFAVAITILVFELKVPEVVGGSVFEALLEMVPEILIYIASFGIVGIFWIAHHTMFSYFVVANRTLLWLNLVFLMYVCSVPFVAAFLNAYPTDASAVMLYGFHLLLTSLFFALIWYYGSYKGRLISPDMSPELRSLAKVVVFLPSLIYFLAMLVALFSPSISKILYTLVPLTFIIPSPIDRLINGK